MNFSVAKILCVLGALFAGNLSATPVEVPAPIRKIFIPYGFDNNDNVEIILAGEFSDSCFQVGNTRFTIDHEKKEIYVWATAYDYAQGGAVCNEVLVPFLQKISVGLLQKGQYSVILKQDHPIQTALQVFEATTSLPDEHLYAPVSAAFLTTESDGKQGVTLVGKFPMLYRGCMVIQEVKMYRNPTDVLVVLPIVDIVEDDRCAFHKTQDFKLQKMIPDPISGEVLVHVRVSNGNSINQYFDGR